MVVAVAAAAAAAAVVVAAVQAAWPLPERLRRHSGYWAIPLGREGVVVAALGAWVLPLPVAGGPPRPPPALRRHQPALRACR